MEAGMGKDKIDLLSMLDRQEITDEEVRSLFEITKSIILADHFVYAIKPDGWYHGNDYVNKDAIYPFPIALYLLCRNIANHFQDKNIETVIGPTIGGVSLSQLVALCMTMNFFSGGKRRLDFNGQVNAVYLEEEPICRENLRIPIEAVREDTKELPVMKFQAAGLVKIETMLNSHPMFVSYSEKIGTKRVIRRGFDKFIIGKKCLVVEDVVNSGNTVAKVIEASRQIGGEIVAVGALADRSGGKITKETFFVDDYFTLVKVDMPMFKEEECPICQDRGRESVRIDLGKGKEFLARIKRK